MASREVLAIIGYLEAARLPFRVTATIGRYISPTNPCSPHTASSLHCADGTGGKGLAVDIAGVSPGASTIAVQQMSAVWRSLTGVAPQLAELFFNGPGITKVVKNGQWRDGVATLGATTWAAHRNHLHVAVRKGVFLRYPAPLPVVPAARMPQTMPTPVHDYEEATTKTMLVHIGPLDAKGNGHADWQPGLGRDPIIVGLVQHGPSPPDDGYWPTQSNVNLSAQPRGGSLRITVRGGTPGDTVSAWATVA